jgi:hypothetical protein
LDTEEENPNHEIHYQFVLNLRRSDAEVQQEIIKRSFRTNELNAGWIRDVTFLSRRDPINWGVQNRKEAQQDNSQDGDQWDPDESFL